MVFMSVQAKRAGAHKAIVQLPLKPQAWRAGPVRATMLSELPVWESMYVYIIDQKDKFTPITPKEAKELADTEDWVLVDVRPSEDFKKATMEGAINVPFFQRIDLSSAGPGGFLRAAAYAINGVQPVEPNPNFEEEIKTKGQGRKLILCCDTGGTIKPSTNFMQGKTSRSLKAAYCVLKADLAPEVAHLEGGIVSWSAQGLPTVGEEEYDSSVAGRSPNSAEDAVFPGDEKK